jgi:hypothetical protein
MASPSELDPKLGTGASSEFSEWKAVLWLSGSIGLWFFVGYFVDRGHGLPGWYMLIFFAIPFVFFAVLASQEQKRETFRLNLNVQWQEEGCLLLGFAWIGVSFLLASRLHLWAALLTGVPVTLLAYGGLLLLFRLLVLLLLL